MKVLDASTATTRSSPLRYAPQAGREAGKVQVILSGMGSGDEAQLESLNPDGTGHVKVAGTDNPITTDGVYVFDAGPAVLTLDVTNASGNPITAHRS